MSFDLRLNKEEQQKFKKIMNFYYQFNYVVYQETEEHFYIKFLGEDMEKDCLLQEELMCYLDSAHIEEIIGGK